MQISAVEISELIKEKIQHYELPTEARTEGTVISLTDGIARLHGFLPEGEGAKCVSPILMLFIECDPCRSVRLKSAS